MTDLPAATARFPARRLLGAPLVILLLACAQPPVATEAVAKEQAAPPRQPSNVSSVAGAYWLEREDRAEKEKPELVLAAMDLRPGQIVADVGAGTGFFSRRLARAVGPAGKVYAVEIQREMLELLAEKAAGAGLTNILPVLGTETDPKLPRGAIDRVLLVDVYHEFQQPKEMLARIRQSLAPGGTVTLVEYRLKGETAAHIDVDHRMSAEQVLAEWNPAGFELVEQVETLPSQHLFVFTARRGARPVP
jgi:predicted methyltransferase